MSQWCWQINTSMHLTVLQQILRSAGAMPRPAPVSPCPKGCCWPQPVKEPLWGWSAGSFSCIYTHKLFLMPCWFIENCFTGICCSFLLCLVSEQKKLQPLSFYRGSIGAENSSYAPWICSVRWLSVFCWGVRCCLWRLLKLFKLECFPAHVQFSGEWNSAGAQGLDYSSCSEGTQVIRHSLTLSPWLCFERFLEFLNRAS